MLLKNINNIIIESKTHCKNAGESYLNHMKVAFKISFNLIQASLMAMMHAIIPAFFQKSASEKITKLYECLNSKKRIN